MAEDLYRDYTRTKALVAGADELAVLSWSVQYFRSNYQKHLPHDTEARILEIGCGYGRYIKALAEMGYRNCNGIDTSVEQVDYAVRVLSLANVVKADALDYLAGKEEAFDVILAIDVMEHMELEYLLKLGKAVRTALKPGGRLIVQVPNDLSPMNPFTCGDLTHLRAFTPASVSQLFLLSGLDTLVMSELPPLSRGAKGYCRRLVWALLIKPVLASFMVLAHGKMQEPGIFTANMMAVARKSGSPPKADRSDELGLA